MSRDFRRAAAALYGTPWAIRPAKLREIVEIFEARKAGAKLGELEPKFKALGPRANRDQRPYRVEGSVAIVPIVGSLHKRVGFFEAMSGGVGMEAIERTIRGARADAAVKAIVLDVDSPGGSALGPANVAQAIYESRGGKPIVAVANSLMCSAAYEIAAAADEIVVGPDALVGSIGVYCVHEDWSAANQEAGVKVTTIKAGRWKAASNPNEPLSTDGREQLQAMVDEYYRLFLESVARHRGMTAAAVKERMAEGRDWIGQQAIDVGAADRVGVLADVIEQLNAGTFFGGTTMSATSAATESKPAEAKPAESKPATAAAASRGQDLGQALAERATEQQHAAATGLPAVDPIVAERQRIGEIRALVELSRIPEAERTKLVNQLVDSGATLAAARATVTEAVRRSDAALGDAAGAGATQTNAEEDRHAKLYDAHPAVFGRLKLDRAVVIAELKAQAKGEALEPAVVPFGKL